MLWLIFALSNVETQIQNQCAHPPSFWIHLLVLIVCLTSVCLSDSFVSVMYKKKMGSNYTLILPLYKFDYELRSRQSLEFCLTDTILFSKKSPPPPGPLHIPLLLSWLFFHCCLPPISQSIDALRAESQNAENIVSPGWDKSAVKSWEIFLPSFLSLSLSPAYRTFCPIFSPNFFSCSVLLIFFSHFRCRLQVWKIIAIYIDERSLTIISTSQKWLTLQRGLIKVFS